LEIIGNFWLTFIRSEAFPVTPLFLFSAGASAMAIISLATIASCAPLIARVISPVMAFGRLSLTMYVAHLVMAGAISAWLDKTLFSVTRLHVVYAAVLFCCAGICFAVFWLKFFRRGPLEMVFHRLSMGLQRRPFMRLTCPGAVGKEGS
jgi:uncharacterized membrane protein YeiB